MSKLEVGDSVRAVGNAYSGYPQGSQYNLPRGEGRIVEGGTDSGYIKVDYAGLISPPVNDNDFELTAPHTPIRTVTRREIVPGTYGRIAVHCGGSVSIPGDFIHTSADIRAAATLFNELADVLDENQRDAG